jgi:hypothetical protein
MVRNQPFRSLCWAFAALLLAALPARAVTHVDLELILAVDISLSMDFEEQRLQREGYVAALRDPQVIKAIGSGPQGRIALTYVEWAGSDIQRIVVPWQILGNGQDANRFADQLAAQPYSRARRTSISSAITFSAALFGQNDVRGLRRVIDVSGDGPNNAGELIETARDRVVRGGVTINGLAIHIKQPTVSTFGYFDVEDLEQYYRDCVIGGPGAFALAIRKRSEFATAIRQKLLLEIAGQQPVVPMPGKAGPINQRTTIQPTQFTPPARSGQPPAQSGEPRTDCQVGEKRWLDFWRHRE